MRNLVADRIIELELGEQCTQAEVAAVIGMSTSGIRHIERAAIRKIWRQQVEGEGR